MKINNKILSMSLVLFINTGIISSCSQQAPNTASSNGNNTTIDTSASAALTSSDLSEIQGNYQDDEITVADSEDIGNSEAGFNTKALTGDVNTVATATTTEVTAAANANAKIKTKTEREEILKDRIAVVKDKVELLKDKLNLYKDLAKDKIDKLRRKEVTVKTSDVVTITNSDGTTSKILDIKFTNKNDNGVFRENKIIKTFSTSNVLIKVEHYITVNKPNYTRTYSRITDISGDGSKQVLINSTEKWDNGRMRVLTEQRSLNADGSGFGTGTVTITDNKGNSKTYNITINISVSGNVVITP
jgi:hypothetical protein